MTRWVAQKNDDDGIANDLEVAEKNNDKKTHRAAAAAVATLRFGTMYWGIIDLEHSFCNN